MIALPYGMPLIRLGNEEILHYEESWIEGAIRQAAGRAGHAHWWPARDVARGVMQFLRDRFPLTTITLADLFERIGTTLRKIGFSEIAGCLEAAPPPVAVDLCGLVRAAGTGYELAFYSLLGGRLSELRQAGVVEVQCIGLRAAVRALNQSTAWDAACGATEAEAVGFIRSWAARQDGRLRMMVVAS